jgi:hypothetical protein
MLDSHTSSLLITIGLAFLVLAMSLHDLVSRGDRSGSN